MRLQPVGTERMCMWGWQRRIEPALCPALVPPGVRSPAAHCLRSLWAGGDKEETSQRVQGFSEEVRKLFAPVSPSSPCFAFRITTSGSMLAKSVRAFVFEISRAIYTHVRAHTPSPLIHVCHLFLWYAILPASDTRLFTPSLSIRQTLNKCLQVLFSSHEYELAYHF